MDNTDQAKGKLKQAVGDLTGNKDLKSKGEADEKAGDAKAFVATLTEKAEDLIDSVKHAVTKD